MPSPYILAVKMAVADAMEAALVTEEVKSVVAVGVSEVNLVSYAVQPGVATRAVKAKITAEEIARNQLENRRRAAERNAAQAAACLAKKEEAKLAKAAQGEVAKPSKYVSYEVLHVEHCEQQVQELLALYDNHALPIVEHPLIICEKFRINVHGARHMLGIELQKKTDIYGNVIEKVAGLHFNFNGRVDKYLSDKVVDEAAGIVRATVSYGNLKSVPGKTFFPSSWTVEQLFHEMRMALLNLAKEPKVEGDCIVLVGKGSNGINIRMVFQKNGDLITAYPALEIT